jgi:integrase
MRHTFITLMANESGCPLHQVAKICGTSITVMENHYLSRDSGIEQLPEI